MKNKIILINRMISYLPKSVITRTTLKNNHIMMIFRNEKKRKIFECRFF